MIVLGAMLKSNVARFVALTGSQADHLVVKSKVNKLELSKNPTRDDVETLFKPSSRSALSIQLIWWSSIVARPPVRALAGLPLSSLRA